RTRAATRTLDIRCSGFRAGSSLATGRSLDVRNARLVADRTLASARALHVRDSRLVADGAGATRRTLHIRATSFRPCGPLAASGSLIVGDAGLGARRSLASA